MNYHDYVEIMKDEELEESDTVHYYLNRAKYWQRAINNLKKKDMPQEQFERTTKKFTEYKIYFILMAIDFARLEKKIGFKINEQYYDALESLERKLYEVNNTNSSDHT